MYIITDILLKVVLNTNKTGHHVVHVCCNWHAVESVLQHQKNFTMLYVIADIFLKVELNTNKTDHHVWYTL
jgi:hypothetical protein